MSDNPKWREVPEHLKESIDRYVKLGVPTGGFLRCCLANDLKGAVTTADQKNIHLIQAIVMWLVLKIPYNCHGSEEIVSKWIEEGGLKGQGIDIKKEYYVV